MCPEYLRNRVAVPVLPSLGTIVLVVLFPKTDFLGVALLPRDRGNHCGLLRKETERAGEASSSTRRQTLTTCGAAFAAPVPASLWMWSRRTTDDVRWSVFSTPHPIWELPAVYGYRLGVCGVPGFGPSTVKEIWWIFDSGRGPGGRRGCNPGLRITGVKSPFRCRVHDHELCGAVRCR